MLKQRELQDCSILFELMAHPDVFPFVRHKANSYEEFLFVTKQAIEAEEQGSMISRTILDEWGNPIGCISLHDIEEGYGFLGTWLGKPYHGLGYNKVAKDAFFHELFIEKGIESIFMRIRKINKRSFYAASKLPYALLANETRKSIYDEINENEEIYDLFEITKDNYLLHTLRDDYQQEDFSHLKEA
jgi:RimJ/RimL family protein N-acetyltransferase